jgi:hypothetical protein
MARGPDTIYAVIFCQLSLKMNFVIFSKSCCKRVQNSEKMDKKNVQNRTRRKTFVKNSTRLYINGPNELKADEWNGRLTEPAEIKAGAVNHGNGQPRQHGGVA